MKSRGPILVRVVTTMRMAWGDGVRRRDATFEIFAADVLELNRGVADLILLAEQVVELDENAGARRGWNVVDGDVTGECA